MFSQVKCCATSRQTATEKLIPLTQLKLRCPSFLEKQPVRPGRLLDQEDARTLSDTCWGHHRGPPDAGGGRAKWSNDRPNNSSGRLLHCQLQVDQESSGAKECVLRLPGRGVNVDEGCAEAGEAPRAHPQVRLQDREQICCPKPSAWISRAPAAAFRSERFKVPSRLGVVVGALPAGYVSPETASPRSGMSFTIMFGLARTS
jgi:hypothetical protein